MRAVADHQHHRALHRQIASQDQEGTTDHAQCGLLALPVCSRQLPDHHRAGGDLDQRVQAEPRQRHRPSRRRGDCQDGHPDHVPGQGDAF
jgi:hypothetical protein